MSFTNTAASHAAADAVGVDVGMQVVKSAKGWEVKSFTRYGTAELSKQIQPGDVLMAINEKNTTLMALEAVYQVCHCSARPPPPAPPPTHALAAGA